MKKFATLTLLTISLLATVIIVFADEPNSITVPDTDGEAGLWTSMALDSTGNPVVSYYESINKDLRILHCNDPNCAGGDDSVTNPDSTGDVGWWTSLELDSAGNPVVSYQLGNPAYDLKLMHCNDPDCAGSDESITSPDTAVQVGFYSSLALDSSGNPVISYYDDANDDLKIMHCNDPNCAGGDESITSPDTAGLVGSWTSLELDSTGNPVVSYSIGNPNYDLKVMHCNDPNCAGGDESITSPDTSGEVGDYSSLVLDGAGNPVVSYYDSGNEDLKLLHCNDANCSGGGESITSPDTAGSVGRFNSLALDSAGNPVISYHDGNPNFDLKVIHCNDPNCLGGDESITRPDTGILAGQHTSIVLDSIGRPVVAYHGLVTFDLLLLHCGSTTCNTVPTAIAGGPYFLDEGDSVMLNGSGSYDDEQPNTTLNYAWDYDNDGQFDDATGIQPVFSAEMLDGPQNLPIGLEVTDNGGLTDTDFTTVTVNNVAPQVNAGDDVTTTLNTELLFTGVFTDPGRLDTHTILWQFGDGTTISGTLTPTHIYTTPGVYDVTLTVTDDDAGVGSDTLVVNVILGKIYLPIILSDQP